MSDKSAARLSAKQTKFLFIGDSITDGDRNKDESYYWKIIKVQDKFDALSKISNSEYWLWDGIHPTEAGHGLLARTWIEANAEYFH